jgi:hypothetical protein
MVLLIAAVCFAALCFNGLGASTPAVAAKAPSNASAPVNMTSTANLLIGDSGTNISIMNRTLASPSFFGIPSFGIGQTVKFTPPKQGWKLEKVLIYGSDFWNASQNTTPVQGIFALEIRDAKMNLLHQYADTQLAYFTSVTGGREAIIDVPAITMNGDFYVCFYGGGIVSTLTEIDKATGRSYYYVRDTGMLLPGALPTKSNTTLPVNWLIRAYGE